MLLQLAIVPIRRIDKHNIQYGDGKDTRLEGLLLKRGNLP